MDGRSFVTSNIMTTTSRKHKRKATLGSILALGGLLVASALVWRISHAQTAAAGPARVASGAFKYTNKLIGESSPYLLEHAHNPVNWYPWGAEALDKAKRENKPIFLSIGYSACHWCHVMAREDFENEEIAAILNAHFIAIKVDREQRPDIDAQYMLALQAMTGSGGWPMSVFLTPDRKPFYGGSYFPPDAFKTLLNKVVDVIAKHPDGVRAQADGIVAALANASRMPTGGKLPSNILQQAVLGLKQRYDLKQGGFSQRPKFPEAPNLAFLLARYRKTGDKTLLAMVTNTLDHMAAGGIYDQLGGGFHRYSTDAIWRVPHFEKMLYDQALLVDVTLDAYAITHRPRYKQVVEETLAFVNREMRDKSGGFYSTLDADSEGEEGKYYLWTPEQVHAELGQDASSFDSRYGVTSAGDLDGKSVLHLAALPDTNTVMLPARIVSMRRKMFDARGRRVRPHLDDKVLANWNGLMLAAYARAYQILGEEKDRQTAIDSARFLTRTMMPDGQLRHSYRNGKADIDGMLEDYAFCAEGLLSLYEATHDKTWLDQAKTLATRMGERFRDTQNGGFYSTASQGDLLLRLKEGEDNATPSGNGVAAQVLARLATLTGEGIWRAQAMQTIQAFQPLETRAPMAFPALLTAYQTLGADPALLTPASVVRVQGATTIITQGVVTVTLPVHIQQGWHINAHTTSANYLTPTALTLTANPDVKLMSVRYPEGRKTKFAFSSDSLLVYQDKITLTARLQLSPFARPGRHTLHFRLGYQPCNEHACLAPSHIETNVTLVIP